MSAVVEAEGLRKEYDGAAALRGVDLTVDAGTVVGLLGPNGAGKTTLVETVEGLRVPTGGSVRVFGRDPRDGGELHERIGVQLQRTNFPETLSVAEILDLFRSFYRDPVDRVELLDLVELADRAEKRPDELSGGQRQRLALAAALAGRPDLVILDEPTAGLDPAARRSLHDLLRRLRGSGRTILLTTHDTAEAEKLCDRVLILRDGRLVADGSPVELVRAARGESRLRVDVAGDRFDPAPLLRAGAEEDGSEGAYRCFTTTRPARALEALGSLLRDQGLELQDLRLKRPTLEDVYLELMDEAPPTGGTGAPRAGLDGRTSAGTSPGGRGTDG